MPLLMMMVVVIVAVTVARTAVSGSGTISGGLAGWRHHSHLSSLVSGFWSS